MSRRPGIRAAVTLCAVKSSASQDNPHGYTYTGNQSSKEGQDPYTPKECSVESLKQHGGCCTQPAPGTLCDRQQAATLHQNLWGSGLNVNTQAVSTKYQQPSGTTLQGPAVSKQQHCTTLQGPAVSRHIPAELYRRQGFVTSSQFILDPGNNDKRCSQGLEYQAPGQNVQGQPVNRRHSMCVIPRPPVVSVSRAVSSAEERVRNHLNGTCTSTCLNDELQQQGSTSNMPTEPLPSTPPASSTHAPQYRLPFCSLHTDSTESTLMEGQSVNIADSHSHQEVIRNKHSLHALSRISYHSTVSDSKGWSINTNQGIISVVACHSQVSTVPENMTMTTMSHLQTMAQQSPVTTTVSLVQAVSTVPHSLVVSTMSHLQAVPTESNTETLSSISHPETVSAVGRQPVSGVSTDINRHGQSVVLATSEEPSARSTVAMWPGLPQQDQMQPVSVMSQLSPESATLQQMVTLVSGSQHISSKQSRNQYKDEEDLSGWKGNILDGAQIHTIPGQQGTPTQYSLMSQLSQGQGLMGQMSSAAVTVPLNTDTKQGLHSKSAEQTPDGDTADSTHDVETTQDPVKTRAHNITTSKAGHLSARKQGSPSKVRAEVVSDVTHIQTRSSSRKQSSGDLKKPQQRRGSTGRRKHQGRKTRKKHDGDEQLQNAIENKTSPAPGRPVAADLTVMEADQQVLQQLVTLIRQLQLVDHQTLDDCISKMLDQLNQQIEELQISTGRSLDNDSDCQAPGKINTGMSVNTNTSSSSDEENDIMLQDGASSNDPVKTKHICEVCGKAFTQRNNLANHRRTHTGERPFRCDNCGKAFTLAHHLQIHQKIHSGERPFRCKVCNKTFIQSQHLVSHQRVHIGEKPYRCDVCGRSFAQRASLYKHKRTHTKEKPFQCDICGKHLGYTSSLALHKRTHTQQYPYQCQVCGKKFIKETGYIRHTKKHFPEERAFTCEFCGKTFTNSWSLALHRRSHTGERPYQCDFCGRKFAISANLTKHKRTHTGEKPYMCHQCGKSFAQKSTLSTHMMAHIKPVACQYCGKGFARKWDMLKHLKVHTGQKYIPSSQSSC